MFSVKVNSNTPNSVGGCPNSIDIPPSPTIHLLQA